MSCCLQALTMLLCVISRSPPRLQELGQEESQRYSCKFAMNSCLDLG